MEYIAVAIFLMVVIVNQTIEVMIAFVKAIVMEVNLSTYLSQSLSTLGHIHKFQNITVWLFAIQKWTDF